MQTYLGMDGFTLGNMGVMMEIEELFKLGIIGVNAGLGRDIILIELIGA